MGASPPSSGTPLRPNTDILNYKCPRSWGVPRNAVYAKELPRRNPNVVYGRAMQSDNVRVSWGFVPLWGIGATATLKGW